MAYAVATLLLLLLIFTRDGAAWHAPRGAARARPRSPVELAVYGLRPANLSTTLENRNTGDAAGDLFFFLTDRFVAPYACRVTNGSWWACGEQRTLAHDSVYTKTVLEVEGAWPNATAEGRCSSNPGHACYSPCNPTDANGSRFSCGCARVPSPPPSYGQHHHHRGGAPCDVVGRAAIEFRYVGCADGCHAPSDQWKADLSKVLGGSWYSTTAEGDCANPHRQRCAVRARPGW